MANVQANNPANIPANVPANIPADVFTAHTPITLGYLRNGPAANVAITARESALAPKYHFRGIRFVNAILGDPANRVTPCPAAVIFEAQLRAAFSQIVEDEVAAAQRAHATAAAAAQGGGAPAFDADAARAAAVGSPRSRIEAIAIGAVHAALVTSYRITNLDLIGSESGPALLDLVAPTAAATEAAYNAALATPTAGWSVALASGNAAGATTPAEDVMIDMVALNADELDLAFALMTMGQAAPVRAGAQLFIDGHHYHSDADSSARNRAIEREIIGKISTAAKNLWRANLDILRNAVWHAGVHAVIARILQGWAEDPDMPSRLDATKIGSMSVGLPAQEDLFSRAGSYIAVYNQVLQTATAHGHTLSIADMTATVRALEALPRRAQLPAMRPDLPGNPSAPWPAGCDTRAKALKAFLAPALDTAEPVAAWMFGFYKEICARAGIRASSPEGSLLRSYSLKRAVGNYLGEANRAQEMYSTRARYIRAQAEVGNLETYTGSA